MCTRSVSWKIGGRRAWKPVPWGWDVGRGEVTREGGEPWARGRVSGVGGCGRQSGCCTGLWRGVAPVPTPSHSRRPRGQHLATSLPLDKCTQLISRVAQAVFTGPHSPRQLKDTPGPACGPGHWGASGERGRRNGRSLTECSQRRWLLQTAVFAGHSLGQPPEPHRDHPAMKGSR